MDFYEVIERRRTIRDFEQGEIPDEAINSEISQRRSTPGSVAFVPSVMGLLMAGEIVKDLIGRKEEV